MTTETMNPPETPPVTKSSKPPTLKQLQQKADRLAERLIGAVAGLKVIGDELAATRAAIQDREAAAKNGG